MVSRQLLATVGLAAWPIKEPVQIVIITWPIKKPVQIVIMKTALLWYVRMPGEGDVTALPLFRRELWILLSSIFGEKNPFGLLFSRGQR